MASDAACRAATRDGPVPASQASAQAEAAAGTPVMAASPMAALDLPLKVLVWDDAGQTKVSYYSPAELAARHRLGPGLAGNLAAIGPLTDALVSP